MGFFNHIIDAVKQTERRAGSVIKHEFQSVAGIISNAPHMVVSAERNLVKDVGVAVSSVSNATAGIASVATQGAHGIVNAVDHLDIKNRLERGADAGLQAMKDSAGWWYSHTPLATAGSAVSWLTPSAPQLPSPSSIGIVDRIGMTGLLVGGGLLTAYLLAK